MYKRQDKDGLIHWVNAFTNKPRKVFVVHGEDSVCEEFTQCLKEEYGFDAYAPYTGTSFDLITGPVSYTHLDVYKRQVCKRYNCWWRQYTLYYTADTAITGYIKVVYMLQISAAGTIKV